MLSKFPNPRLIFCLLTCSVIFPFSLQANAEFTQTNENFETGDLAGWTAAGAVTVFSDEQLRATGYSGNFISGAQTVIFGEGDRPASGVISRDLVTVPGQKSVLTFDYGTASPMGVAPQLLVVTLTDTSTSTKLFSRTVTDSRGESNLSQIYNTYTFRFIPLGSTTRLMFQDASVVTNHVDALLDNISLNIATPATAQLYKLSQPLETIYEDDKLKEQMDGTVLGQCVYGGYCARTSAKLAHNGVDYRVEKNTLVYAICDGTVKKATKGGAISSRITVIDHSASRCGFDRLFAYYGHIDPIIKRGEHVIAGQVIGKVSDWKKNSHLQLSLNSRWLKNLGYTNIKKTTPKNCKEQSVLERRRLLDARGWLDPIVIGMQSDWTPAILKGGAVKTGCNATDQEYAEKTLPYQPWKK